MNFGDKVTVIMTTYNNIDFTKSSFESVKYFYPDVRVILADGGSNSENLSAMKKLVDSYTKYDEVNLFVAYNSSTEMCRNMAVGLVDTPFILTMDNDTKILGEEVLPILFESMRDERVAETGAYGVKVFDEKNFKAFVGQDFNDHMEVDAFVAYCALHRTEAYKQVGGQPVKEFFYDIPKELWEGKWQKCYTGDLNIGRYYQKAGWKLLTPKERVPVVHWGKAYRTGGRPDPANDWWYENCTHIRCNPLNKWEEKKGEM